VSTYAMFVDCDIAGGAFGCVVQLRSAGGGA
jgi:hypothetical protein